LSGLDFLGAFADTFPLVYFVGTIFTRTVGPLRVLSDDNAIFTNGLIVIYY
jgi:hypothetical protein